MRRPDRIRRAASRRAAIAVAALGVYVEVVEWIDLAPWNKLINGSYGQEALDVALAVILSVLTVALWQRVPIAPVAAVLMTGTWAALQIAAWWVPYFRGASPAWEHTYATWFADTVHWIPAAGNNLPPDANHLVLQTLIVAAFAASFLAVRAARR